MTAVLPTSSEATERVDRPAWNLAWLTPTRCRLLLALLLLSGAFFHFRYLTHDCPVDLSGDEAQYWDWSRNLDLSYYSKGPLVAYIIRASCTLAGADTMPAVRYPAILFGVGTSLVTYLLTRKLFGSERLALGAVLLNHIVPMFVAGSILMTIDPPMFFCWALATYFAAIAIFDGKSYGWLACGLAVGFGFLAKYAVFLWFPALLLFLLLDVRSRSLMRSAWPWITLLIALAFTTPVLIWNVQHDWVSFRHVAHQTGASGGGFSRGNFLEFVASQIGVLSPVLFIMMISAGVYTIRRRATEPHPRQLLFLLSIGAFFFGLTMIVSLFAKVQVNWPAPAYFTLLILTAYWISTRLRSIATWRPWRPWFWGTVAIAVISTPLLHDMSLLFPVITRINSLFHTRIDPAKLDISYKLRGWSRLGDELSSQLAQHPNSFILCDDYMQTAEAAFYTKGKPKTYYVGSYYSQAKRYTQYDMWPDRRLDNPDLRGRDGLYVGKGGELPADIARAFERVEALPEIPIVVRGVTVRTFRVYLGRNFKGMTRPATGHTSF